MRGKPDLTFISLVQDTIRVHGLHWAVAYYSKRLTRFEARFFLTQAYLTFESDQ